MKGVAGERRLWAQMSRAQANTSIPALRYSSTLMLKLVVWASRTTMRLGKKILFSLCWAHSDPNGNSWW